MKKSFFFILNKEAEFVLTALKTEALDKVEFLNATYKTN
jgi:hypothetical protein